jgi:hypothetical protein
VSDEELGQARDLAERLRAEGYHTAAERMEGATLGRRIGGELLDALREACEFVLTTIEALDPKTTLMAEELRLEVEKRLHR